MAPLPPPEPGDDATADLTAVLRVRRRAVLTRRLIVAGSVLAVLALVAVAWFSPVLGLAKVDVSGSRLVSPAEVSAAVLADHAGTPLPQLRPGAIESEVLEQFPRAAAVSVHYGGPRTLTLTVTDRTPVLAVTNAGSAELYDADAVDLGSVASVPKGLTVLDGAKAAPDSEAVGAVIDFLGQLRPELRHRLLTIEAPKATELRGTIASGKKSVKVVFGDSDSASLKVQTAIQLAADGRTGIDVSVPSVPVTD